MALRSGVYIVPTDRWYIERTVWLIAGVYLLTATALAALHNPLWAVAIIAMGCASINVALTGFCIVGNVLRLFGFTGKLCTSEPTRWNVYFMQTDRWYLERRICLAVGFIPLERISDIRRVTYVMKDGNVYDPAAMYGAIGVRGHATTP